MIKKNQRFLNMQISSVIRNSLFVNVICPFVLLASTILFLFPARFITVLLFFPLCWAYFLFRRSREGFARLLIIWIFFILSVFSPIDISFKNYPGPPRMVTLVMGLPMGETLERAERGEIMLGGCVVTGHEPKHVLVW